AAEVHHEVVAEQDPALVNNGGEEDAAEIHHEVVAEQDPAPAEEGDVYDEDEDLGLTSLFTDHEEALKDENPELTGLDDDWFSLYDYEEEGAPSKMSDGGTLYQLAALLSGKEPTTFVNPFLEEAESFTPNPALLEIQKKIRALYPYNSEIFSVKCQKVNLKVNAKNSKI
ncbi:MAG: hypothetical protein JNJ47_08555, partial [Alphaproteobacteria bacterium]|nr:hypothetical protein [Alphaproteobacteria bacterium]